MDPFHTDFRLWVCAIKWYPPDKIGYAMLVLPLVVVYFVANSVAANPFSRIKRSGEERRRPQARAVDGDPALHARVLADLRCLRTPRQIAGRLRLEAREAREETIVSMIYSPDAQGRTVSHEAIYRWIYAHTKGELAKQGILLRSKRTSRRPRRDLGQCTGGRIVGMVSIDDRPVYAALRVPGAGCLGGRFDHRQSKQVRGGHPHGTQLSVRDHLGLTQGETLGRPRGCSHRSWERPARYLRGSLTWDQGHRDGQPRCAHDRHGLAGLVRSPAFPVGATVQ